MDSQNNSNSNYGFRHGRRQSNQFDQGSYYYEQEYGRNQDDYEDRGSENDPDYSSVANNLSGQGHNYGYNQGRNYNSTAVGRAYGQNYDQRHQGEDLRYNAGDDDYRGRYNERGASGYTDYSSGNNDRGFYNQDDNRYNGNDDFYYNRDANDDRPYSQNKSDYEYQQYGYQSNGQTEGFGHRAGHRNETDWNFEDDYREGDAQNHRPYGKYGSR